MAVLRIRNVGAEAVRRFERRARASGRSLEAEAGLALASGVKTRCSAEIREQFLRDVKALQKRYPARPDEPAEVLIRQDRDYGHREL